MREEAPVLQSCLHEVLWTGLWCLWGTCYEATICETMNPPSINVSTVKLKMMYFLQHPVAKPITTCKFKPAHTKVVKCQERASQICDIKVNAADPGSCGHTVQVPCFQAESMSPVELARRCHSKCSHPSFDKEGECGHFCRGQCLECYQGRLHVRCKEPCGRMLTCGHR